jgi:hypothetical protein
VYRVREALVAHMADPPPEEPGTET